MNYVKTSVSSLSNVTNIKSNKINPKIIIIVLITIIILTIIIYLVVCAIKYNKVTCYKKKDFHKYITDFSDNQVCSIEKEPIPIKPKEPPKKKFIDIPIFEKKEVFHIANQDYTYDQSKCKCESYGATLATKAQVIDAYNNGANWCSYGWSEGQGAYYPVQKCDWDKMTLLNERLPDKEKKYCGIPGINGGHFPNPLLKFGVNCYGKKPNGQLNKPKVPYCPPMNFCKLEKNFEASNKLDTDEINGFNSDQWNMKV
jgi:hypothetical protein